MWLARSARSWCTRERYGKDHATFEDTLAACAGWMRGVAVVYDDTPEEDIARWHALGARGTRCNALFSGGTSLSRMRAIADRVREHGWHLQLLVDVGADPDIVGRIADLGLPVVVDHFGHLPAESALESKGFQNLLSLVREGRAWVKLSGAYRISEQRKNYTDVAPLAEALLQANESRLVWGSDWPHPSIAAPMADDTDILDALAGWLSPDQWIKVLAENPRRLYWADSSPI
ncbi:amidohydrolase family protein [Thauera sp. SDU_THAU2]|uniref:amidohydrolase family protein n=1 Tax=Thauera sp. SDU_THAU2 TaxID=3136633 RepID=UPI00311FD4C2